MVDLRMRIEVRKFPGISTVITLDGQTFCTMVIWQHHSTSGVDGKHIHLHHMISMYLPYQLPVVNGILSTCFAGHPFWYSPSLTTMAPPTEVTGNVPLASFLQARCLEKIDCSDRLLYVYILEFQCEVCTVFILCFILDIHTDI